MFYHKRAICFSSLVWLYFIDFTTSNMRRYIYSHCIVPDIRFDLSKQKWRFFRPPIFLLVHTSLHSFPLNHMALNESCTGNSVYRWLPLFYAFNLAFFFLLHSIQFFGPLEFSFDCFLAFIHFSFVWFFFTFHARTQYFPTPLNLHVNFIHSIKCIDWIFICSTEKWTKLYV